MKYDREARLLKPAKTRAKNWEEIYRGRDDKTVVTQASRCSKFICLTVHLFVISHFPSLSLSLL